MIVSLDVTPLIAAEIWIKSWPIVYTVWFRAWNFIMSHRHRLRNIYFLLKFSIISYPINFKSIKSKSYHIISSDMRILLFFYLKKYFLIDPIHKFEDICIDAWSIRTSTAKSPRHDTYLVVWEFSISVFWEHHRTTGVPSARILTTFGESSTKYNIAKRNVASIFTKSLFTFCVWKNGQLNLVQYAWFSVVFSQASPSSWKRTIGRNLSYVFHVEITNTVYSSSNEMARSGSQLNVIFNRQ